MKRIIPQPKKIRFCEAREYFCRRRKRKINLPTGTFLQQLVFAGGDYAFICSGRGELHQSGAPCRVTVRPAVTMATSGWHADCIGQNIISSAWFYARLHRIA
jgi:hypothetical protein